MAHISKPKIIGLDAWSPDEVRALAEMGNARSAAIYLANVPDGTEAPDASASDRQIDKWVRDKYEKRRYVAHGITAAAVIGSPPRGKPRCQSPPMSPTSPSSEPDFALPQPFSSAQNWPAPPARASAPGAMCVKSASATAPPRPKRSSAPPPRVVITPAKQPPPSAQGSQGSTTGSGGSLIDAAPDVALMDMSAEGRAAASPDVSRLALSPAHLATGAPQTFHPASPAAQAFPVPMPVSPAAAPTCAAQPFIPTWASPAHTSSHSAPLTPVAQPSPSMLPSNAIEATHWSQLAYGHCPLNPEVVPTPPSQSMPATPSSHADKKANILSLFS